MSVRIHIYIYHQTLNKQQSRAELRKSFYTPVRVVQWRYNSRCPFAGALELFSVAAPEMFSRGVFPFVNVAPPNQRKGEGVQNSIIHILEEFIPDLCASGSHSPLPLPNVPFLAGKVLADENRMRHDNDLPVT